MLTSAIRIQQTFERIVLALALAVLLTAVVPVTAQAADVSGWTELLEFTSVSPSGSNIFKMGSSGTLAISLPFETRLRKVDILLTNPNGQRPTSATCTLNGNTTNLEIYSIGGSLTRICGYIPDGYHTIIPISLKKGTSSLQTYEVLSWKVTPLGDQEFVCDARVYMLGGYYGIDEHIDIAATDPNTHHATMLQTRIDINDWMKYDKISVWGSSDMLSIDSIRASLGTAALPITVNYFEQNDAGEWVESVFVNDPYHEYVIESGSSLTTPFFGKYLFNVFIDLTGVDRSKVDPIHVYLTGNYDQKFGATFNCQFVNGSVTTADTAPVSWWHRFTSFMSSLFQADSPEADQFENDMQQQGQEVQDAADEIDTVTRPALEDVDVDIGQYIDAEGSQQAADIMGQLFSSNLVVTMVMISLMVALASFIIFGKR